MNFPLLFLDEVLFVIPTNTYKKFLSSFSFLFPHSLFYMGVLLCQRNEFNNVLVLKSIHNLHDHRKLDTGIYFDFEVAQYV